MIIKSLHMQLKKDPHETNLKWVSSACFTNDTSRVIVKRHESHLICLLNSETHSKQFVRVIHRLGKRVVSLVLNSAISPYSMISLERE